jgi:hypothetical protein
MHIDKFRKEDGHYETDIEQKKDLDWIFEHGDEVLDKKYGASAEALAACFGLHDLWGNSGEGFVYYDNVIMTLIVASLFLRNKDKQGWLNYCKYKKEEEEREVSNFIAMIDILTDRPGVQTEMDQKK